MAWNPETLSEQIADEWVRMTFDNRQTTDNEKQSYQLSIKEMMLSSHETCVDYMMPLGLHHIFAWDHHYGPEPWCEVPGARPDGYQRIITMLIPLDWDSIARFPEVML